MNQIQYLFLPLLPSPPHMKENGPAPFMDTSCFCMHCFHHMQAFFMAAE